MQQITAYHFTRWESEHGEDFFDQFAIVNEAFLLGFILAKRPDKFELFRRLFIDEKNEIAGVRNELLDDNQESESLLLELIAELCSTSQTHNERVLKAFKETGYDHAA